MRKILLYCFLMFFYCGCNLDNNNINTPIIPLGSLDGSWYSSGSQIDIHGKYAYLDHIFLLERHGNSFYLNNKPLIDITSFNKGEMILYNRIIKTRKLYIKG